MGANKTKKTKKNNTGIWVGASAAVLAGAAVLSYTQKSWPFSLLNKQEGGQSGAGKSGGTSSSTGSSSSAGASSGKGGKSGKSRGGAPVDVALNNEVASATQSSPSTENDFTDEGATGNND